MSVTNNVECNKQEGQSGRCQFISLEITLSKQK